MCVCTCNTRIYKVSVSSGSEQQIMPYYYLLQRQSSHLKVRMLDRCQIKAFYVIDLSQSQSQSHVTTDD
jgi:hypothetical protein